MRSGITAYSPPHESAHAGAGDASGGPGCAFSGEVEQALIAPSLLQLFNDVRVPRVTPKHALETLNRCRPKFLQEGAARLRVVRIPPKIHIPRNPPGAGFEYQDGGPHLLSAVIAEVTGQTTLDYVRRVLFEPLDIQTRPAYQGSLFASTSLRWRRSKPSVGCAITKASIAGPLA